MRTFLLALMTIGCFGQNTQMLVTTEWLAGHLNDPKVVVLHVGTTDNYSAGHIPGARLVRLGDISVTGPRELRLELPPVEQLVAALTKLGVKDDSRVVIYPSNESIQSATRVWFTFDYLGLGERASLLDGGLASWRAEGRALSTEEVKLLEPGAVNVKAKPELVVDADWLQARLKKIDLIDSRQTAFFNGADPGGMPRAGRIPGARNVPYVSLMDGSKWRKPEELKTILKVPGGELVTYCHIGQQATVPYFAARMLGLSPKLYDGSFQDWSQRSELPIEQGAP